MTAVPAIIPPVGIQINKSKTLLPKAFPKAALASPCFASRTEIKVSGTTIHHFLEPLSWQLSLFFQPLFR